MISKLRVVSLYFYSVNKMAAGDGHSPGLGDGRPRPVSALNAASLLYFLHVTFSSKNQLELIIKEPRPMHFIQWIFFFFKSKLPKSTTQSMYFILLSHGPEGGAVM